MKWYLHNIHRAHLRDLKVSRNEELELYYSWVGQIANTFTRDSVAIGILNYQDLLQAGYEGLINAWNQLDHDRDQAQKWTYIKKRIKWSIRREIDKHSSFISRPINRQEEARNEWDEKGVDRVLVTVFPKFFDKSMMLAAITDTSPWESVLLGEVIDDYLYGSIKNVDHVEILRASFGIDRDRKVSAKELADKYDTSVKYIGLVINRLKNKLKKDEKFKKIIENFYENR